jgi:hypothetical protein
VEIAHEELQAVQHQMIECDCFAALAY